VSVRGKTLAANGNALDVWPWITAVVSGAFLALVSWAFRDVLRDLRDRAGEIHRDVKELRADFGKLEGRLLSIETRLSQLERAREA